MAWCWLRLRADLRRRWRPMLSLALLLGLIGGVVLTAAAGARRTDTAYPRLLQWANGAQVDILPEQGSGFGGYYQALAKLPQVAAMSANLLDQFALPVTHGDPDSPVQAWLTPRGAYGVPAADRVKILSGQPFDRDAAGQAMIDQQMAGFTRSQVLRVVAWEASAFAAVAVLAGLPAGIAAGRLAWALFADSAGVSGHAAIPLPLVLLTVPVTLLVANLIAVAPGWRAARVRPAAVLRAG
jgi:hypothetical protein